MRTSSRGLELIKQFEGFSVTVYRDVAGLPTIGYGHLLREGEANDYPHGISHDVAEHLLRHDLLTAERTVGRLIHRSLTQNQFDALTSFTFNLGSGALQRSTLRRVINRGENDVVSGQWMRFVWAGGRKVPGLVRRRAAELALYME